MSSPELESDSSTNSSRHSFYNLCAASDTNSSELSQGFRSPPESVGAAPSHQDCECHLFAYDTATCPHKYLPKMPPWTQSMCKGRRRSSFPSVDAIKTFQQTHAGKLPERSSLGCTSSPDSTSSNGNRTDRSFLSSPARPVASKTVAQKVSLSGVLLASVTGPLGAAGSADETAEGVRQKSLVNFGFSKDHHATGPSAISRNDYDDSRTLSEGLVLSEETSNQQQDSRLSRGSLSLRETVEKIDKEQEYIWHRGRRLRVMSKKRYDNMNHHYNDTSQTTLDVLPPHPKGPDLRKDIMKYALKREKPTETDDEQIMTPVPPLIDVISPSPTFQNSNVKLLSCVGLVRTPSPLCLRAITPDYLTSRSTSSSGSLSPASQRCVSSHSNSSVESSSPLPQLVRTPTLRRRNLLPPINSDSRASSNSSRTSSPFDPSLTPHSFSPLNTNTADVLGREISSGTYHDFSDGDLERPGREQNWSPSSPASPHSLSQPFPITFQLPPHPPQSLSNSKRSQSGDSNKLSNPPPAATGRRRTKSAHRLLKNEGILSPEDVAKLNSQLTLSLEREFENAGKDFSHRSPSQSTTSSLDVVPPDPDDYFTSPDMSNAEGTQEGTARAFYLPDITRKPKRRSSFTSPPQQAETSLAEKPRRGKHKAKSSSQPLSRAGISLEGNSIRLLDGMKSSSKGKY